MFHCCHLLAPLSCTYALPSHLCSETISDSPRTAACSHTGLLLSAAHLCRVLSCSLLNHHPHSQHSTVFSPMAHLLVALVGALPGADSMQRSTCSCLGPHCTSLHQLAQLSDLSLPGPSISFVDLCWAMF